MKKIVQKEQLLLEVLESLYPDSSRRTLRTWVKVGKVTVDGRRADRATLLIQKGEEVCVGKAPTPPIKGITILYEDPHLVIVYKPMGLLSVPLEKPGSISVLSILREHYQSQSIYAVHRIDQKTSGILVLAKSEKAREEIDKIFKNHDLIREYLAIVEGRLSTPKGTWESRLVEHTPFEVRVTTNPQKGRLSITHYEVIRTSAKFTYLRLVLETGRKHQIRVHCKEAGHPICGDKRYDSTMNPFKRLCLHANRIAFTHPFTGKKIDITAKPSNVFI